MNFKLKRILNIFHETCIIFYFFGQGYWYMTEKIHQPNIFFIAKIINCLFFHVHIHVRALEMTMYYAEYKLKEEDGASFETKLLFNNSSLSSLW